ncbi:hypothetical protein F66182_1121 [Fusarium sp. NRRL 66182]|nr:hypothetical protein F66182_1121 [Fusarium sp. NRRL 66182]
MRRVALNKTKSRLRDTAITGSNSSVDIIEAHVWHEGLRADHHHHHHHHEQQLPDTVTVPPAPHGAQSSYSQPHPGYTNQPQHQSALSSATTVSNFAADAPMTDAFPTEIDTNSVTAAVNTTSFTVVDAPSHQDNHNYQFTSSIDAGSPTSELYQDQEDDIDLDLDLEAAIRAPYLEHLLDTPVHPELTSDYIFPHNADDDLDMSDSEGGAPLDDDPIYEPHAQPQFGVIYPPISPSLEEDNDGPAPTADSVNHFSGSFTQVLAHAGTGLIMDAAAPPAPWGVIPANDAAQLPQALPPMPFDPFDGFAPMSNPNPTMLGSENLGLVDFLRHWATQARFNNSSSPSSLSRMNVPCPEGIRRQANEKVDEVHYDHLHGDNCDIQGLDWESMNTTRRYARQRRCATYKNYVNKLGSDRWSRHMVDVHIPSSESFMRFKKYLVRQDVYLAHFQLRSVIACPFISQVYYPGTRGVNRINPVTGKTELALNNGHMMGLGALISTLDANYGALFAGTFNGEYYLKSLDSEDKKTYSEGQITQNMAGITNHVQIHMPRRSSGPVAAISSNDKGFRVMDLTTEKFVAQSGYRFPLNCSRISPDGRLRVMVGDDFKVLITDADTGQIQQELSGHRDFGFACDWSDDGYTIATGFQDMGVKIWDARRWCDSRGVSTPLCTIRSEMAGVRNLRFSPVGSGERVLVGAEEADYINIINAQTFGKKQTIDVFGEIGGIGFANDGQDLNVLVSDRHRGGLLQLERSGLGAEPYLRNSWRRYHDHGADQWRCRVDEYSHLGEPYHRKPISTDALPIF